MYDKSFRTLEPFASCLSFILMLFMVPEGMLFVDTVVFYTDFKSIWDVPTSAVWSDICVSFVP